MRDRLSTAYNKAYEPGYVWWCIMLKNETKFPRRRKGGELESKTLRRFAPKAAKRLFSGFPSFGVGPEGAKRHVPGFPFAPARRVPLCHTTKRTENGAYAHFPVSTLNALKLPFFGRRGGEMWVVTTRTISPFIRLPRPLCGRNDRL